MAKAYLVGSGIAALAAATFLIRDGGFKGSDIHLFEEQRTIGGSLDAAGTPDAGYTMRGGRMFEAEFRCTYDLLSGIPTLDDPSVSVTEEILAGHEESAWDDIARLVNGDGEIVDTTSMGFSERDRLELVRCLATPRGTWTAGGSPTASASTSSPPTSGSCGAPRSPSSPGTARSSSAAT